jgi:hypothetical protein
MYSMAGQRGQVSGASAREGGHRGGGVWGRRRGVRAPASSGAAPAPPAACLECQGPPRSAQEGARWGRRGRRTPVGARRQRAAAAARPAAPARRGKAPVEGAGWRRAGGGRRARRGTGVGGRGIVGRRPAGAWRAAPQGRGVEAACAAGGRARRPPPRRLVARRAAAPACELDQRPAGAARACARAGRGREGNAVPQEAGPGRDGWEGSARRRRTPAGRDIGRARARRDTKMGSALGGGAHGKVRPGGPAAPPRGWGARTGWGLLGRLGRGARAAGSPARAMGAARYTRRTHGVGSAPHGAVAGTDLGVCGRGLPGGRGVRRKRRARAARPAGGVPF